MSGENNPLNQYQKLIQEMINQLQEVLDENVVARRINQIDGISLSNEGNVILEHNDPQDIVQKLVDSFLGLSNELVVKTLQPLLKQCPWVKIPNSYGS